MDYYHHAKPRVTIGNLILTGGLADNIGRGGYNDFPHNNGIDPLFFTLADEFALTVYEEPFTRKALRDVDIIFMLPPDHPDIYDGAKVLTDQEIENLVDFVNEGGSFFVILNSRNTSKPKFELEQLSKLMARFGIGINDDDTMYSDIRIGREHPYFYDMDYMHYGAGCTFRFLDNAKNPTNLLNVYTNEGYTDYEYVEGPGLAMVEYGKGKVFAFGDTGSFGANHHRPWTDNTRFLQQAFRYLKKDTGTKPASWEEGQSLSYDIEIAQTVTLVYDQSLREDVPQPYFKDLRLGSKSTIPFLESFGNLTLECVGTGKLGVREMRATINDFSRNGQAIPPASDESVTFSTSRLGELSNVYGKGVIAQFLAADMEHIVAMVPNDTIRVGDIWNKIEQLKIVPVQGVDLPAVKPVETSVRYAGDEMIDGHDCRLLRSWVTYPLGKNGVDVSEVLPVELSRKWGGSDYEFFRGGGDLMYTRDQWIDKNSGIVVKTKVQSRMVAWIHDLRKPAGKNNKEIDYSMVLNSSYIVEYRLTDG
jgi:hypothetical protein